MNSITTLDEAMAAIWSRSGYDRGFISNPFAGDEAARLGLVRTSRALELLGNPERDYAIVHVAGSKGKGSTASFIDSIARAGGLRCGRFLSPHLHSYRERFVVDDIEIGEKDFTRLVADVMEAAIEAEHSDGAIGLLTAWELSTVMALRWFSLSHCEIAVIEVGLGGTLDATNVVDPAVSVITSLDYEHTAILGSTMAEIASNKAGIIKPRRPVVSADQPGEALAVIDARANLLGAPLGVAMRDWIVEGSDRSFAVTGTTWRHDDLVSSLFGQHQIHNAGLAVAAVHSLAEIDLLPRNDALDEAVRMGIGSTFIPGRFEIVDHASGSTFVLDGAHSPASTQALAGTLREHFPDRPVTMIVGMLNDKQPEHLLRPLVPIVNRWLATEPASPRALPAQETSNALRSLGVDGVVTAGVAEAILHASHGPGNAVVVVTGSLATVAEARVALGLA